MPDPTEKFEAMMGRVEARANLVMEKVEGVSPGRAIGSERMSDEDLLRDYIPIQFDQAALDQRAKEFIAQHGFKEGLRTFQDWVIEMEKLGG